MTQIILTSNVETAEAIVDNSHGMTVAVVEAEYGSVEVLGSSDELTLNHHVRSDRPCPCEMSNFSSAPDLIVVSHFDLDTLGGVMALLDEKPANNDFWKASAFVDTNGPHRVAEVTPVGGTTHLLLASFWAWSKENRLFAPRDGSELDCTDFFKNAITTLQSILKNEEVEAGEAFLEEETALCAESYREERTTESGLRAVLRSAESFVNHLYYREDLSPADIVVSFNEKFKSVTISASDEQINCREVVQAAFGPLAGGHLGIAGSPREEEMSYEQARSLFLSL